MPLTKISLIELILWVALILLLFSASTACSEFVPYAEQAGQTSTIEKVCSIVEELEDWRSDATVSSLERPCVTLTYAQSLDGKIAVHSKEEGLSSSSNFALSSQDSWLLTHALRGMHDGILVGGNTWSVDNPRLTNRIWGAPNSRRQPRPIVLDSDLKHARMYLNEKSMNMRNPIVCCRHEAARCWNSSEFEVLACDVKEDGWLDLKDVLKRLRRQYGIKTLMVEGGAAVLTSFIQENLLDILCITIAPKFIGEDGIAPTIPRSFLNLSPTRSQFVSLGDDAILYQKFSVQTPQNIQK